MSHLLHPVSHLPHPVSHLLQKTGRILAATETWARRPRTARGQPAWQTGHQKTLRSLVIVAPSELARIGVPHRRLGLPSRRYTQVRRPGRVSPVKVRSDRGRLARIIRTPTSRRPGTSTSVAGRVGTLSAVRSLVIVAPWWLARVGVPHRRLGLPSRRYTQVRRPGRVAPVKVRSDRGRLARIIRTPTSRRPGTSTSVAGRVGGMPRTNSISLAYSLPNPETLR